MMAPNSQVLLYIGWTNKTCPSSTQSSAFLASRQRILTRQLPAVAPCFLTTAAMWSQIEQVFSCFGHVRKTEGPRILSVNYVHLQDLAFVEFEDIQAAAFAFHAFQDPQFAAVAHTVSDSMS